MEETRIAALRDVGPRVAFRALKFLVLSSLMLWLRIAPSRVWAGLVGGNPAVWGGVVAMVVADILAAIAAEFRAATARRARRILCGFAAVIGLRRWAPARVVLAGSAMALTASLLVAATSSEPTTVAVRSPLGLSSACLAGGIVPLSMLIHRGQRLGRARAARRFSRCLCELTGLVMAVDGFVLCTLSACFLCSFLADLRVESLLRLPTGLIAAAVGMSTWDLGRRFLAASRISTGGVTPVVLLRSFVDDIFQLDLGETRVRLGLLHGLLSDWSFESALAKGLAGCGKASSIGDPRELLPRVGSIRSYHRDERWQEQAIRMIEGAELVVIILGETGGLSWEIGEVIARDLSHKILLAIPPCRGEELARRWAAFRESCRGHGIEGLPAFIDHEIRLIRFVDRWTPFSYRSSDGGAAGYTKCLAIFRYDWNSIRRGGDAGRPKEIRIDPATGPVASQQSDRPQAVHRAGAGRSD